MTARTRTRTAAAFIAAAVLVTLVPPRAALAQIVGTRAITTAAVTPMASVLDSAVLSGTLTVAATETARTGTNPWYVTAQLDADLTDGTTGTIPRDHLTVAPGEVTIVGGGGSASPGSPGTLEGLVTLFTVSGQNPLSAYTGTYTQVSTLTLALPNATPTGVYTGNVSVTLVQ